MNLEYLFGLEFHGHKFGLDNIRALTDALGRPQTAYQTVVVAGTNGKGSVCATVARALTVAGHRTGLYTSPHLVTIGERFVVDGERISDDELADALAEVRVVVDRLLETGRLRAQPTFFEVSTSMALLLFRARRVEVAVLEVGLGGRLDATTIADPVAGAITTIDLDHQIHLGNTIEAIAVEKAGIIKPGMLVVCGERKPEAVGPIADACQRQGAQLVDAWAGVEVSASLAAGLTTMTLRTPRRVYESCVLALRGAHQVANAVVAVRLLEGLDAAGIRVPPAAILDGLSNTRWPGRLEVVRLEGGRQMLLDAAHNTAGADGLAHYLKATCPDGLPLVFGAMQDKDIEGMLRRLLPCATSIVLTLPPSPRAAPPAEVAAIVTAMNPSMPVLIEADPIAALTRAFANGPAICVAGSIYLLGAILASVSPVRQRD
ncbi:MAG: folylpolyglutamate synthase/dihydrofolate synthase family protein [Acidobacteriota bacterium]